MSAQRKIYQRTKEKAKEGAHWAHGELRPILLDGWSSHTSPARLQKPESQNHTHAKAKSLILQAQVHSHHAYGRRWVKTNQELLCCSHPQEQCVRAQLTGGRPCLERPPPPDLRHHFTKDPAHENSQVTEHLPTVGAERLTRVNCPYMPYYTQPILNFLTTLASTVYIKWKAA